jgi:hypothetical protein
MCDDLDVETNLGLGLDKSWSVETASKLESEEEEEMCLEGIAAVGDPNTTN